MATLRVTKRWTRRLPDPRRVFRSIKAHDLLIKSLTTLTLATLGATLWPLWGGGGFAG